MRQSMRVVARFYRHHVVKLQLFFFFFFQAEDGIRDLTVTGVQTCALPIWDLPTGGATFLEYSVGTPQRRNAFDVAVTPDNAQVYVSTLADGKVYVFDRTTRVLRDSVQTGGNARYIGFSASGTLAIVANEMGWVSFIH